MGSYDFLYFEVSVPRTAILLDKTSLKRELSQLPWKKQQKGDFNKEFPPVLNLKKSQVSYNPNRRRSFLCFGINTFQNDSESCHFLNLLGHFCNILIGQPVRQKFSAVSAFFLFWPKFGFRMYRVVRCGRGTSILHREQLLRVTQREHLNFGTWWNGDAGWYRRIRGQGEL